MTTQRSNVEVMTVGGGTGSPSGGGRRLYFRPSSLDALAIDECINKNAYGLPEKFEASGAILDIGAHIGSFTVACYQRGARNIYAYEPYGDSYQLFLRNTETFDDCICRATLAAVWGSDVRGGLFLLHGQDPSMHRTSDEPTCGDAVGGYCKIRCDDINAILSCEEHWRFVKLDCEGAEYHILYNADPELLKRVEELAVETHRRDGMVRGYNGQEHRPNHNALVVYLREQGFTVESGFYPQGGNGMIHATRVRNCVPATEKPPQRETNVLGSNVVNIPAAPAEERNGTTTNHTPPHTKKRLMIARFPYGNQEAPSVGTWLVSTVVDAKGHHALEPEILNKPIDDTPITMTRNLAVKLAKQHKVDYLLMVDSDMAPDLPEPGNGKFFPAALDFLLDPERQDKPSIVAAPYGGPPPHCNVYIFRWANWMNESANPDMRLEQFTREEAAQRAGFEEVAALPTGLILIDMRVFDRLAHPYFYYEWTDETESEKASTEDVVFTRNASIAGCPVYCYWDAWAGHWKRYLVPKPRPLTVDDVRRKISDAEKQGLRRGERRIEVSPHGGVPASPAGNGYALVGGK